LVHVLDLAFDPLGDVRQLVADVPSNAEAARSFSAMPLWRSGE
jgi:hypothetical protein